MLRNFLLPLHAIVVCTLPRRFNERERRMRARWWRWPCVRNERGPCSGDPLLSAANAAFASQRTATASIDSVPLLKRVNDSRVFFFDGPGHASSGRTEKWSIARDYPFESTMKEKNATRCTRENVWHILPPGFCCIISRSVFAIFLFKRVTLPSQIWLRITSKTRDFPP